jgi:hypothetical protein
MAKYIDVHTEPRVSDNPLLHEIWEPWARESRWQGKVPPIHELTPERMREFTSDCNMWETRMRAIQQYSYAVPSEAALATCIEHAANGKKLLEIGSGSGYWAALLQRRGANVVAVDVGNEYESCPHFPETVKMDGEEYLRQSDGAADRTLLLCWPRDADEFLEAYCGDKLIVIGEPGDGCTWWPSESDDEWTEIRHVCIPTWFGIKDCLSVFVRERQK